MSVFEALWGWGRYIGAGARKYININTMLVLCPRSVAYMHNNIAVQHVTLDASIMITVSRFIFRYLCTRHLTHSLTMPTQYIYHSFLDAPVIHCYNWGEPEQAPHKQYSCARLVYGGGSGTSDCSIYNV